MTSFIVPISFYNFPVKIDASVQFKRTKHDIVLGAVHKLRWQDFCFFWPPTPLRLHFLWYESLQKVDIFGPPTYLVL